MSRVADIGHPTKMPTSFVWDQLVTYHGRHSGLKNDLHLSDAELTF
jgi:hypothetical protein